VKPEEAAWLDIAYEMVGSADMACECNPTSNGETRWPGYLGEAYSGVLFVGSRHNRERLWTNQLREYQSTLRSWASAPRTKAGDALILAGMRSAHDSTIPQWASKGPWAIFRRIRDACGLLSWSQVASCNLAKCCDPDPDGLDDVYIPGCQREWSLDALCAALKPRIVFLAKGGSIGNSIQITGEEIEHPLVVRYSNHSTGKRRGQHYSVWIDAESPNWRRILET
jgi:hypothetical protein